MSDLNLKYLHTGLLNSEVGHLDVEAVEVDTVQALIDGLGEPTFADFADALGIMKRTHLVELTEEFVELADGTGVTHKGGPVAGLRLVSALELVDDFVEVPWEGEHIGMFLLAELGVDTESGVFVAHVNFVTRLLLRHDGGI